jgi:FAD:protein FMN transferase
MLRVMSDPASIHRTRPAMGTLFEVLLRGDDEEHLTAVADAILDEVQRIDRLLSRFDPRSEISRINRLAAHEPVLVDYEVAAFLETCLEANRKTQGAFDVTAHCRLSLRDRARPIEFDLDHRTVSFASPEVGLDLGGIGKGYALDRAAELLAEHGIEHALIHGGTSSVLACGCDAGGHPWRVALRYPASCEDLRVIDLRNAALSCSATNDQMDIIDPQTGQPAAINAACAVISPSATQAEIFSTACLCLSRPAATQLIEREGTGKVQCIWID